MRSSVPAWRSLAIAFGLAMLSQTIAAQSSRIVIATGLDNPRGLAFGPDGALYVVEAGRGGSSTLCLPEPNAPTGTPLRCYGPSGAVTRISAGGQMRIVMGLPSLAGPNGSRATGPHDIDFGFGAGWVTIGLAANPAERASLEAAGVRLGRLVRITSDGAWADMLDLGAHEAAQNPDGGRIDSNPYGFLITSTGAVFTDAGGNALVRIAANGALATLAVFPSRTTTDLACVFSSPFRTPSTCLRSMESVPTAVVQAPDGGFYVGEFTGDPFTLGQANVYRVSPNGGLQVVATGFNNIIDIALDPGGGGYVLEHDEDTVRGSVPAGRLVRIEANGVQREFREANLTLPGGVVVGPDGAIYVTNHSTSAGAGEVVRLTP